MDINKRLTCSRTVSGYGRSGSDLPEMKAGGTARYFSQVNIPQSSLEGKIVFHDVHLK